MSYFRSNKINSKKIFSVHVACIAALKQEGNA